MGDRSEVLVNTLYPAEKTYKKTFSEITFIKISSDMSTVERHVLNPKKKENKKN
jgi:hypothetical protein